jgi:HlyD family secretion protein
MVDEGAPSHSPGARPRLRRWAPRLAVLAALAGAAVGLRLTVFAPAPIPVRVARVEIGTVEQTATNSRAGTVKARRRARLSPQLGGRVVALNKRKGDRVTKGEVLLELDSTVQRARLALATREHEAARAERTRSCLVAERAVRERDRNKRLAAEGIVSADVLDQVDSAARSAAAACTASHANEQRAAAAVDVARRELEYTVVRAPFDGVVAESSIEVGEWSTPSPPALPVPPVLDILDPSSIYISAPMDEVDSARLAPGLPARVTVDSHPGQTFPGHVVRVASYVLDVEEQNRTVEIEVELDDRALSETLLPGTSADVEVVLETRPDVLRIPSSAVLSGDTVLVVQDGRLAERAVEVGLRNWDVSEIRSGLVRGDEVVTSLDRADVKPGARVVVER